MYLKTHVNKDGFQGQYYPSTSKNIAIIVLGGGEGYSLARQTAKYFAKNEFPALAVAYHKTSQTSADIVNIPVEIVEKAAVWLQEHGFTKIITYGLSKGAELALLAASLFPQISGAISVSGPCCMFAGINSHRQFVDAASWAYQGKSLPYVPVGADAPSFWSFNLLKQRQPHLAEAYQDWFNIGASEENTIKVEHINGPILLLSAHEDTMWNSENMCELLVARLREKSFPHCVRHEVFSPASHFLYPIYSPLYWIFKLERTNRKACGFSRKNAFGACLLFLKSL